MFDPTCPAPDPAPRPRRCLAPWMLVLGAVLFLLLCAGLWILLRPGQPEPPPPPPDPAPTLQFGPHTVIIQEDVPVSSYNPDLFLPDERGRMTYVQDGREARLGVDVSHHQGEIDWEAVADDGISFALLRIGYRGYSEGGLFPDSHFEQNYEGAVQAGLDVGVYFFSQAISAQEATEEADFVLELLDGRTLTYPVVYDWESVDPAQSPRTAAMTGDDITVCAQAFARHIAQSSYQPMIYFNPDLAYLNYDLSTLKDFPFWLARYQELPDFHYDFDLWQFTHTAQVEGISGQVDLNLDLRPVKQSPLA